LPEVAQSRLATREVLIGGVPTLLEFALTPTQQTTGLMFRSELGEDEGMLFAFDPPGPASFWMKNCVIPLSLAYLDARGEILEIYPLEPNEVKSVRSISKTVKFAIEMKRGWFEKHNVTEGTVAHGVNDALDDIVRNLK
jgi:uncharacterized membrane protein (UPF0127 family)